jgi:alpha-N-arabinofuranosidase
MTPRRLDGGWWRLSGGSLRLTPQPVTLSDRASPSLWARRQQHRDASFTTELSFTPDQPGQRAGLAVIQNDEYWFRFTAEQVNGVRTLTVAVRAGENDPKPGRILASLPVTGDGPLRLRVTARGGAYDFAVGTGKDGWKPVLNNADGTILSTATARGFMGVMVGPYAEGVP